MRYAALVFALCLSLSASHAKAPETNTLARIHAALVPMRSPTLAAAPTRSATPALTPVKHALRDWIETRLARFGENGDVAALTVRLNAALGQADLFCERAAGAPDRCSAENSDWNAIGFLGEVSVERPEWDRLVVATRFGILCGFDSSVYAYQWRDGRWARFWASEQLVGPGREYVPRVHHGTSFATYDSGAQLVLSLGGADWCQSNWRSVYYTLSRVPAGGGDPALLLYRSEGAFQGAHDVPIRGAVAKNDALIEFTDGSIDSGVHSYQAVRRYVVTGDTVTRADPIALGPRSFVEEWLKAGWSEADHWTQDGAPGAADWHRRLQADSIFGEYVQETRRCGDSALWQVGIAFEKPKTTAWFLVRWDPPYVFRMAAIGDKPRADCVTADPQADAYRTLFPVGDWYR